MALGPLSGGETRELVAELLTSTPHSEDAETLLVERVDGNPLYAEEFARWIAEGGSFADDVPDSIHAVIAARIDTLPAERKELLHAAAVVGKVFWAAALVAITRAPHESVLANLHELGRKELVRRVRSSTVEGDVEYLFWHVLVRDVAYAQIPRAERVRMHEAAAQWIENVAGDGLDDQSELLAHHYSTALELHRAVHGTAPRELEQGAVMWTVKGGDHALRLSLAAARTLYERALALMGHSDPERASVLTKLGGTLLRSGEFALADATLGEAIEHASALGDEALQHLAMMERMQWRLLTDPWSTDDVRAVAVRAIDFFEGCCDEASLAKAWQLRAHIENAANEWKANTAALERALEHARRAGDARAEADALWWLAVSFYFGSTPVDEAIRRCEEILSETWTERMVEAGVLGVLGALYAMQGRFDEARARFGEGLALLEQLGVTLRLATRRTLLGAIELLADDPVAAERELRWAIERLQAMGEHGDMPGIAAQLAEALYRQGRYEEAEPFAKLSEDEKYPRMRWRGPWAKLLAKRGEFQEAEQVARSVVAEAAASDNLNMQGNALMDLAEVLQVAGRPFEAIEPLQEAVRVFTEKGNVVTAAKAQAMLQKTAVSA